jgi:hypothetical protein
MTSAGRHQPTWHSGPPLPIHPASETLTRRIDELLCHIIELHQKSDQLYGYPIIELNGAVHCGVRIYIVATKNQGQCTNK